VDLMDIKHGDLARAVYGVISIEFLHSGDRDMDRRSNAECLRGLGAGCHRAQAKETRNEKGKRSTAMRKIIHVQHGMTSSPSVVARAVVLADGIIGAPQSAKVA
jgi:hypothetical protein